MRSLCRGLLHVTLVALALALGAWGVAHALAPVLHSDPRVACLSHRCSPAHALSPLPAPLSWRPEGPPHPWRYCMPRARFEGLLGSARLVDHGTPKRKRLALTFDDGPSEYTPEVLEILHEHGVRATFFLIGRQAALFPQYVRWIRDEGHEIENHTYHHDLGWPYTSRQFARDSDGRQRQELLDADRALGRRTRFVRVPGGLFPPDPVGRTLWNARLCGKVVVQWDVDGDTPGPNHIRNGSIAGLSPEDLLRRYESRVQPGSIVLMHPEDPEAAPYTLEILDAFLDDMREQGYQFVTVDEILR